MPRQLPGVHAFDAGDVVTRQVIEKAGLGAPVAVAAAELPDDEPGYPGTGRLFVQRRYAVVTDERRRHGHDLARIRRIGANLLIAREARVEYSLARYHVIVTPRQMPAEDGAILQDQ